ncbi:SdrD B-like domain-containing protein, partial [Microcoleus sp. F6_B6]
MNNLTLLPSNNLISALDSNNNSTLETGGLATLTSNLKFAQQINIPGPEPLPTFTGRIQGTKFTNDLNRNGIFEAGVDQTQPDVTIFLDQNNNGQLDSGELQTKTDNLGSYSFSNLPPASYTVQEIVPPGFERLTRIEAVTVVANQTTNFDIVNRLLPIFTGRISGTKFNDLNRNGRLEAGSDQPQSGVTLFLDQNNNGQLDSGESQTQTDNLGGYSFSNLPPATYTVQEIVPAGFTRVTPVQPVTVVANETTNFDILNIAQTTPTVTGSISGRKFNDINANGILDVGEPGIPGFTIYIDLNRNNIFDSSEPSRLTDATGSYQFNDLQPDTYTLREVQQPGFVATQVPDPVTIPLSTSATVANFTNINFGNRRDTGSISGRKFIDVNANRTFEPGSDRPQSGVTLFLDINNNAQPDSGELQTQTDSLGGYSFSNIPAATYTVQEIVPAGFTRVTPVQPVTVVANQTINFDIANVQVPPPPVTGSISGRKFIDINNDRNFTPGTDQLQSGVTLFLDQNNNAQLDIGESQTQTDNLGAYSFSNLPPATYTVQEIVPAGFTRVTPVQAVTVVANQPTNFDIANVAQIPPTVTGSISGRKFIDINNDRNFTPGTDQLQSGVTLF